MKATRNIALIIMIFAVLIVCGACSKTKTPEGFTQEDLAFMSAEEQIELFKAENQIKEMYKKIVDAVYAKGYDVMILPTMPTSHIAADFDLSKDTPIDDGIEYPKLVGGLYTVPFNMLNWMPVVSVPAGLSPQHMPIGMQIVGQPGHTETVFKVAYNYSLAGPKFYEGDLMPEVK